MKLLLVFFGLVLAVVILAAIAKSKRGAAVASGVKLPQLASKSTVMDKWEAELYERLVVALKTCHVFPQVAMSAFLKEADRRSGGRGSFSQKYVDFLVCERHTFKPLYVIELDGRSHGSAAAKAKDAKRDAMLATAGIPVKRYTSSKVEFAVVLRDYMEVVGPAHSSSAASSTQRPTSSVAGSLGGA
ncbi:DUF2726 domain-containing protein [Ralstonia solanacearum]|uniref:DUF2726 domain-containing protein n=1 Tax=Ralstonia solanacearum TaxID=305 RepID=UPI001FF8177F|nr:DUF2726 domain-containing protein [Ralstonia solanacearum]